MSPECVWRLPSPLRPAFPRCGKKRRRSSCSVSFLPAACLRACPFPSFNQTGGRNPNPDSKTKQPTESTPPWPEPLSAAISETASATTSRSSPLSLMSASSVVAAEPIEKPATRSTRPARATARAIRATDSATPSTRVALPSSSRV